MGRRRGYSYLSRLPAWWLLDESQRVIASVRAVNADEARNLFKAHGLSGVSIRKGDPEGGR